MKTGNDILVLIDMQNDFLMPDGKLWIGHDASEFVKRVEARTLAWEGPVFAMSDWHPEHACEFDKFPPHCLIDSWGSQSVGDLYEKAKARMIYKNGFASYTFLYQVYDFVSDPDTRFFFAGVLASVCVQENVANLHNFWKQEFNKIPKIIIEKDLVDDVDEASKDAALRRMQQIYGAEIR